MFAEACK